MGGLEDLPSDVFRLMYERGLVSERDLRHLRLTSRGLRARLPVDGVLGHAHFHRIVAERGSRRAMAELLAVAERLLSRSWLEINALEATRRCLVNASEETAARVVAWGLEHRWDETMFRRFYSRTQNTRTSVYAPPVRDSSRETPWTPVALTASRRGFGRVLHMLLHPSVVHLVEWNASDSKILRLAVRDGLTDIVAALLAMPDGRGGSPTVHDSALIAHAASHRDGVILDVLLNLDPRLDLHSNNESALRHASMRGHAANVRKLLDLGADPTVLASESLRSASAVGAVDVVRLMLDWVSNDGMQRRVDRRAESSYAIRIASLHGHVDIVRMLLEDDLRDGDGKDTLRADPRAWSSFALRKAAENEHIEIVRMLLLDGRALPDAANHEALRSAVRASRTEVLKLLTSIPMYDTADKVNAVLASGS